MCAFCHYRRRRRHRHRRRRHHYPAVWLLLLLLFYINSSCSKQYAEQFWVCVSRAAYIRYGVQCDGVQHDCNYIEHRPFIYLLWLQLMCCVLWNGLKNNIRLCERLSNREYQFITYYYCRTFDPHSTESLLFCFLFFVFSFWWQSLSQRRHNCN